MSEAMLTKMNNKLERLEAEFSALFENDPRMGHMGTPNITDNSKGRQMMRVCAKLEDRRRAKKQAIEEQKEKIERMESRIAYRTIQTKKSEKFIAKNPIDPRLFELEKQGVLKQWKRNPEYFFVVGLDKVALLTSRGKIGVATRFYPQTKEEIKRCIKILEELK